MASPTMSNSVALAPNASTTETVMPDWYTNYAQQILANQKAISSQPYTNYQGPRIAGFTPDQQAAFGMTRDAANYGMNAIGQAGQASYDNLQRSSLTAAQPYFSAAGGMSGVSAASPALQQAAGLYTQSIQGGGLQAADPYLQAASGTSVGNINAYMNPYTDAVVNRIGDLGARTLREKLIPEISDRFVGAGSYGGSRNAEMMGRAMRDTMEGISAQQSGALQAGYGDAAKLAQGDLARQAQLAQTAGGFGIAQQQALQAAGAGMSNIGQTYGNLTAEQQRILSGLGTASGNLYSADTQNRNQSALQLANMGEQRQRMGLTGANAVAGIGQQQQQFNQGNLDMAYQDFLRQQNYPQFQNTALMGALQGTAGAIPKGVLQTGYGPTGQNITPQPSAAQNLATTAGALANIASIFKGG
jgi:hypothetical protein